MGDILRVNAEQLRAASAGWNFEVPELHAQPPMSEPGPWPTHLAAAGVSGAAQAATADLHARITGTAGATQVSAAVYEVTDSDAADLIGDVISGAVQ